MANVISIAHTPPLSQKADSSFCSSKCKVIASALAIILALGCFAALAVGVCCYTGTINTLERIHSIVLMGISPLGVVLLIIGIIGLRKNISQTEPPNPTKNKSSAEAQIEGQKRDSQAQPSGSAQSRGTYSSGKDLTEEKFNPVPLPPILSIEMDGAHPLQQVFPFSAFCTPDAKGKNFDDVQDWEVELACQSNNDFYYELLNIPLVFWLDIDRSSSIDHFQVMNLELHKERIELINKRIEYLNQTIQLARRMKALKTDPIVQSFKISSLWSDEGCLALRLQLLNDEEVMGLRVDALDKIGHNRIFRALFSRLSVLRAHAKGVTLPKKYTKEGMANIALIDLARLPIQQISSHLYPFIPPLALGLIPLPELKYIQTEHLLDNHWVCLAQLSYQTEKSKKRPLVRCLTPQQIEASINGIECLQLLQQLSNKQLNDIENMRIGKFNEIFNPNGLSREKTKKRLHKLSIEFIYRYHSFFSREHWRLIGKKHILSFDFDQIFDASVEEKQRIFDFLFPLDAFSSFGGEIGADLLKEMEIKAIYKLGSFMSRKHWGKIGEKNVLAFDFGRFSTESQQALVDLFFNSNVPNTFLHIPLYPKLLPQLSPQQRAIVGPHLRKAEPLSGSFFK